MLGYLSIKQIGPEVFRQSYSAKKNPFENNHRTFYSQILRKKRKKKFTRVFTSVGKFADFFFI